MLDEPNRASVAQSPGRDRSLFLRIRLHYRANDPVALEVDLKNVWFAESSRSSRSNALNHYLVHGPRSGISRSISTVSSRIWENDASLRGAALSPRPKEAPRLAELSSRAGVFVVEMIGNGRSSRALIKKGGLRDERTPRRRWPRVHRLRRRRSRRSGCDPLAQRPASTRRTVMKSSSLTRRPRGQSASCSCGARGRFALRRTFFPIAPRCIGSRRGSTSIASS